MENTANKQTKAEKLHKSKFWIVKNIYFYIIGINLGFVVFYKTLSKAIDLRESIIVGIFLLLAGAIVSFFGMKWAVKSVLQKSTVRPHEFLPISLLIGIIPIVFVVLISGWIIFINLERFSGVAWYLIPRLLSEFITAFMAGLFYGIASYFWLRRLSS